MKRAAKKSKTSARKKPANKKTPAKKAAARKVAAKKPAAKQRPGAKRASSVRVEVPAPGAKRGLRSYDLVEPPMSGLGADTAGQAGDIEALTGVATADSQSVRELLEEGQAFEAGVVSGVENAADADASEVTTREVPEDDVPLEYRDQENPGRG
ncbi:MAG TPA: hypothetical protein VIG06_23750 [Kofleriaceae bacterium]|jgi:hypothetical protein